MADNVVASRQLGGDGTAQEMLFAMSEFMAQVPGSEPEIQPPASILTHFSVVLSTVL